MFEKSIEQKLKKVLKYMEKYDEKKVNSILLKNKDNIELFDRLLQESIFTNQYFHSLIGMDTIFQQLNPEIQKKYIRYNIYFIKGASFEVRDDINFMRELMSNERYEYHDFEMICDNLGGRILMNKEYMYELAEHFPSAFVRSIGNANYTEEEIKIFFSKYPYLLNQLPPQLKSDLKYVSSCIFLMPTELITSTFGYFDYNYLIQEEIKTSLIKKVGNKSYQKILATSLATDNEFLRLITPEEFRKMIVINPDVFVGIESDLYTFFHSNQNQRKNLALINGISKISELNFNKINSPDKFSHVIFNLSKYMVEEIPYAVIYQNISTHWNKISSILGTMSIEYVEDGKIESYNKEEIFKRLYNILVAIKNNKLNEFFQVCINYDLMGTDYIEGINNLNITNENIDFLKLICTTEIITLDNNSIEIFNQLFKKLNNLIKEPYLSVSFLNQIVNDKRIFELILKIDINSLDEQLLYNLYNYVQSDMNEIVNIDNIEDLRNINKTIEEHISDNDIFNNTLDGKKYLILIKHFNISLANAKKLIHSYFTSNIDNSLYKDNPKILYLKQLLEKIINTSDEKTLSQIENDLISQNVEISFVEIQHIVDEIKRNYGNKINESLVNLKGENKIYDFTNKDFNLLVHVIGAYGDSPKGDIYDSWNTKEGTSTISICTSFISEDNMEIAPTNKHSVVLGFANLPPNFLQIMSCNDLYSTGFSAERSSRFLTPEELKNNTRHGHNEIVINRRIGEYTEQKLQPSYIICFDNVNEESKIAAEKFGVPIIFIDREKVADKQHNEITSMLEKFKATLEPVLISEIICKQENNKAGYRIVRPDLVDKYFNKEFRQNNINIIYSIIESGLKNNHPNAINCMNTFIKAIEEEVGKFKVTAETPHRRNSFDIEYDVFLTILKENPNYNSNYKIPKELSTIELYAKFIECRKRLSESESIELQFLNNNMIMNDNNLSQRK